jgi:hypothetical protein
MLEEVAVVAGHLQDEAVGTEPTAVHDSIGQHLGVGGHGFGVGGEVGIVGEELLGRDGHGDLCQRTTGAKRQLERVTLLDTAHLGL